MLSTVFFQKNWGKLPSRISGYRYGLSGGHKLEKKIQKHSFERQRPLWLQTLNCIRKTIEFVGQFL